MQVNVQKLSPVLVEFAIEIPEDRVRQEVDRAYRELSRTARVKGFRPGKAPREVLQHIYGGQIAQNVTQRLVDSTLNSALKAQNVQPLATLEIAPGKLAVGSTFGYRARFEVSPDIAEVKYDKLKARKPATKASDEQVAAEVERLREDHATLRTPEPARPAQKGDQAIIDFELEVDGKTVSEGSGQDVESEVGSGKLLKEIEEALLGANVGDKKDAQVTFSDQHPRANLRGKTGVFHISVKEIKERILPELNDDFARECGEFETLDALKADLRSKIEKRLTQEAEDRVAEQLVVELCKANPIPAPPSLVQRQAELTQQEIAAEARRRGQRPTFNEEQMRLINADAEMKVRAGLLMAAIAKEHSVMINNDDFERAYAELAEQSGKNVQRIRAEYNDQKKREILTGMILEDKILDIIEGRAEISDEVAGEAPAAQG